MMGIWQLLTFLWTKWLFWNKKYIIMEISYQFKACRNRNHITAYRHRQTNTGTSTYMTHVQTDTDTDTPPHSHSLSISTVAERWNSTPLTVPFTLEKPPQQHVYALFALNPHHRASVCVLALALSLFTVNLSFTEPPCFSLSIPEDREIIWTVCSPPALLYALFPTSPPVGKLPSSLKSSLVFSSIFPFALVEVLRGQIVVLNWAV